MTAAERTVAAYAAAQLGIASWPRAGLVLSPSPLRERAGWGGWVHPLLGMLRGEAAVVSIAPAWFDTLAAYAARLPSPGALFDPRRLGALRAAMRPGAPGAIELGPLLFCDRPARLRSSHAVQPLEPDDPRLPAWAGGRYDWRVFAVMVGGSAAAAAAVKAKSPRVWEIAVGTAARFQGRGMATAVVAAATRAILNSGRVPVYLHEHDNAASARVAARVGYREFARQVWATR